MFFIISTKLYTSEEIVNIIPPNMTAPRKPSSIIRVKHTRLASLIEDRNNEENPQNYSLPFLLFVIIWIINNRNSSNMYIWILLTNLIFRIIKIRSYNFFYKIHFRPYNLAVYKNPNTSQQIGLWTVYDASRYLIYSKFGWVSNRPINP